MQEHRGGKRLSALNVRAAAGECHIAPGTLYNSYSGKDKLPAAAVRSVWKEMFHMDERREAEILFSD